MATQHRLSGNNDPGDNSAFGPVEDTPDFGDPVTDADTESFYTTDGFSDDIQATDTDRLVPGHVLSTDPARPAPAPPTPPTDTAPAARPTRVTSPDPAPEPTPPRSPASPTPAPAAPATPVAAPSPTPTPAPTVAPVPARPDTFRDDITDTDFVVPGSDTTAPGNRLRHLLTVILLIVAIAVGAYLAAAQFGLLG